MTITESEIKAIKWGIAHKEEFKDDPIALAFLEKLEAKISKETDNIKK